MDDKDTTQAAGAEPAAPAPVAPGPGQELIKLYRKDSEPVEVVKGSESERVFRGRGFGDEEPEAEASTAAASGESASA